MQKLTVAELAEDAKREFSTAFGSALRPTSCRTFGEAHYRGGFQLVFSHDVGPCEVVYSDMELEVSLNGIEIFGPKVHVGFEGNMFSREHLREYLPRIAASAAAEAGAGHVQG
jgi:hypothetical protein